MRSITTILLITGLAILLAITAGGCVDTAPPPEAANASDSTAEGLFLSFNTGDYGQFSEHFSEDMKKGLNETGFDSMRSQIQDKYGNYTSKTLSQSYTDRGYNSFIYDCKFEKGTLKVRLVMNATDLPMVEGLWFPNGV